MRRLEGFTPGPWFLSGDDFAALAAAKAALADAHESLTDVSSRFSESEEPIYIHSAIAFCECGTAKAYRAAKAALKAARTPANAVRTPLYSQENEADPVAVVKFFDPCGSWTWFATEYDPATRTFFGLVKGFEEELGYFSLDELESVKGPLGIGIERDLYFKPTPLSALKGK